MTNHIRTIIFSAMFSFAAGGMQAAKYMMPMHSPWSITTELSAEQTLNSSFDEINIRTEGRKVHVSGAEDKTLEVYNIAGVKVASFLLTLRKRPSPLLSRRASISFAWKK